MYRCIIGICVVIICISILSLLGGCGTFGIPSVCDKPENQTTILCKAAKALDVHLEITGEVLASINSDEITSGVYTKAKAIEGIAKLRRLGHLATGEIDVSSLGVQAASLISKYRTLRLGSRVILIYLAQYGKDRYFTPTDLEWWDYWMDSLLDDVNSLETISLKIDDSDILFLGGNDWILKYDPTQD